MKMKKQTNNDDLELFHAKILVGFIGCLLCLITLNIVACATIKKDVDHVVEVVSKVAAPVAEAIAKKEIAKRTGVDVDNSDQAITDAVNQEVNKGLDKVGLVSYTVSNKDCLWKISKKVYGTPWAWPAIYDAN